MGTIIGITIVCAVGVLIVYPALLYYWHTINIDPLEQREQEWKFFAARLAIIDYQMVVAINSIRETLGQHKLDLKATIEDFEDWRWKEVINDARQSIQGPINTQDSKGKLL